MGLPVDRLDAGSNGSGTVVRGGDEGYFHY